MNMKEFAAICGVSPATVSYALRNDSRISEPVRERIQSKAREVNYRPDSSNSALVRYRKQSHTDVQRPSVAIAYAHPPASRRTKLFQVHVNRFRQSIQQYGYDLKEYYIGNQADGGAKLLHQMRVNDTQGLVLAWGQWEQKLNEFPWQEFAVASAERNQIHPAIDRVSVNHFNATEVAIQALEVRGARRIGLVCHHDLPLRVKKNIVGAYIQHIYKKEGHSPPAPPYFYKIGAPTQPFEKWRTKHQLDAILSHRQIDFSFFNEQGLRFPQDSQYAVIEIDDNNAHEESGVVIDAGLGDALAEVIAAKLHYGERVDLQRQGDLILINGQWREGITTHPPEKSSTEIASL